MKQRDYLKPHFIRLFGGNKPEVGEKYLKEEDVRTSSPSCFLNFSTLELKRIASESYDNPSKEKVKREAALFANKKIGLLEILQEGGSFYTKEESEEAIDSDCDVIREIRSIDSAPTIEKERGYAADFERAMAEAGVPEQQGNEVKVDREWSYSADMERAMIESGISMDATIQSRKMSYSEFCYMVDITPFDQLNDLCLTYFSSNKELECKGDTGDGIASEGVYTHYR